MPKIDLHRHLEGSLRLETLLEIAQKYGLDLPAADIERLRPYVQITDDPPDHEVFLSKFEVLRHFYRSPEAVSRLAYEVVADAASDNIHYLELRFSPQALARVRGFSLSEVADWVIDATQQASQDLGIIVRLIVTLVRHDPIEQAKPVAEVAFERFDRGIVGLDLAGNEVKFPAGPFKPLFTEAKRLGMGVTVHAGEWASAEGVRQAIEELHADRIGHGIRSIENSRILRLVRDRQVALEVCLTSNLQTGVVHQLMHHPLVDLLNLGVKVTLNTDDPTVSNSLLTDEYRVAVETLGLGYADLRKLVMNAANATFLPEVEQQELLAYFDKHLPTGK
ncbi:MAG: adenosine deaminase [Ardenticatenaceae bacterium]|nr:adenosine deaminase [Ardenticatenaceae bacterium]MCB8991806.1 adenosine deaminase [Ardenticatenaceae bacterium]